MGTVQTGTLKSGHGTDMTGTLKSGHGTDRTGLLESGHSTDRDIGHQKTGHRTRKGYWTGQDPGTLNSEQDRFETLNRKGKEKLNRTKMNRTKMRH